jgi:peptidoglycan/xylan/chitin deacetylase (PgdA/CDA1 family)
LSLKRRGFESVTFEDLSARKIPKKSVLLTFDDGYEDNYHFLFPLLKKHRMKAVLYLLGDRKHAVNFWDTPKGEPEVPLLKESQILEMSESGWVEFGAHSLNHAHLTELSPAEAEREITGSKKALEDFLKKPVLSFAYPYGSFNEEVKKMTARAGYTFGVAVSDGPSRFGGDLMEIRRIHMFPKTSSLEFMKKTSGFYLRYRKLLGK